MGRKSLKETRREEIIKVFYKVAKKEGYENTSIAKIANVMGINPSLIIHYFKTKEDLTYELINYILDRYLLIYTTKHKGEANLTDLQHTIEMLFSKEWNHLFDDSLFYTFYALAFRNKKVKLKYKIILDALRKGLADMIKQCNDQSFTHVENPQIAADFIFVLVDGAYFYLSMQHEEKEYIARLEYYKFKAYEILSIAPLES